MDGQNFERIGKIMKKISSFSIKLFVASLAFNVLLCFSSPIYAYSDSYTWSSPLNFSLETSSAISTNGTDDTSNPLNLDCGSCILIEQKTGQILYSYNSHEKLKPASVTKLMSIYLIMDAISLGKISYDTKIPCSANAESMGGSQIWLTTTEELTVDEMLKAICIVSANDCVTAMAEYLGGTEENFVNVMNEKAKTLGMNDTNFRNCHGIDEDDHYTSSYDIALLSRALLNNYPEITKYTTIYMDTLRDGKSSLVNTNKLVRNYNGCTGLKTGSTSLALYNLSASATRDNMSLIAVVMKAPSSKVRFSNASSLLDYGFTNFEYKELAKKNEPIKSIKVDKGVLPTVDIIPENDCGTLIAKGNDINIEQNIVISDNISAPISQGEIIGKLEYRLNGDIISETNLVAKDGIDKIGFFSMEKLIVGDWFELLR